MTDRKKMVAIMTGSFHTDYSRYLARKLYGSLIGEGDFSVCLMQGLDASRFLNLVDYVDDGFDSHYYTQFEYSKFIKPDYLVVSYGTISAIPNPLTVEELLDRLPDVPVIVLESEIDRPNCVSVTMDNWVGMKDCVEHLILEHDCRDILFVSGPESAPDAEERRRAYLDTMLKYGLDVTDDMIACGDFNVAHKEIDLAHPESNHMSAGFTDEEREGFTNLLAKANALAETAVVDEDAVGAIVSDEALNEYKAAIEAAVAKAQLDKPAKVNIEAATIDLQNAIDAVGENLASNGISPDKFRIGIVFFVCSYSVVKVRPLYIRVCTA